MKTIKSAASTRKRRHIDVCLRESVEPRPSSFVRVQLRPRSLPELNRSHIETNTVWLNKTINLPFYIASMTGGTELAGTINHNLAEAAEAVGVGLALGSCRILINDNSALDSFKVRQTCPSIPLLGNIGAAQLVHDIKPDQIQWLVDELELDGFFIHLNVVQEALQTNGDSNWQGILPVIEKLVKKLSVPVFVKEVGSGIDLETGRALLDLGVSAIDLAGRGGTSWPLVERLVSQVSQAKTFDTWGTDTVDLLLEYAKHQIGPVYASGGLRSGLDIAKALVLGASLTSAALPLLKPATESSQSVIELLRIWHDELITAMLAVGVTNLSELASAKYLIAT